MQEQRRHQRIRFSSPPVVNFGYLGGQGNGLLENISLSGLMLRTNGALNVGHRIGCEFSIHGSRVIDVPATVVSRVGDLFGARFQPGPIAQIAIEDAMGASLSSGQASVLSLHTIGSKKIIRITGGLTSCLRNDFMHALSKVGVDEIDTQGVSFVDQAGLSLCIVAVSRHGALMGAQSTCFAEAWNLALAVSGTV